MKTQKPPRKIEIFPYGFTVANGPERPVLLFKDKSGHHILPVWVHPLDASMALHEHTQTPAQPHLVGQELMKVMGIKPVRCDITELTDHRQYATIHFSGPFAAQPSAPSQKIGTKYSLRLRADHAMSFCLAARIRFYSTAAFMARCRQVGPAVDELAAAFEDRPLKNDRTPHDEKRGKNPSYMM